MKKLIFLFTAAIGIGVQPAFGQFGSPSAGAGPHFDSAITILFGTNQSFSAQMNFQTTIGPNDNASVPGKIVFDAGKSRFEMNISEMVSSSLPSSAAAQMKAIGMDTMVAISRPDLKQAYLVYPGLNSYATMASTGSTDSGTNDAKLTTTELGKETIEGHDCIKNNAVVTDKDGNKHESTVWNAGDLNNFPVKIITTEGGKSVTMIFKNVSFEKPAASAFEAPSGYTKYNDVQTMLSTEVMRRMGGGGAPAH
jgi:hypothetical protein